MAGVKCFSSLSGESLRRLFKEIYIDKDYEGFVRDSLFNMFFYNSIQSSEYNSSQCNNLCYAILSKLSAYSSNNWRFQIPREEVYFRRNRAMSEFAFDSAFDSQGRKIMERAWKEIYRVVKEAEEYLKLCSQDIRWITAITLANPGEAYALHIHDLAWSVLCLDFHLLFLKYRGDGSQSEVYSETACRKISDFHAEMSNLSRIHDEYQDKRQLISIFQQWLQNSCQESMTVKEENKVKAAKFLSAKLQATIRSKPAITGSRVSPWLQIDPDDLVLTNGSLGHGNFGHPKYVYAKIMQGERPHLPPTYPPVLVDYIKKCWDTDPQRRPGFPDVSNFMRYMKLLIMRMEENTSDCDSFSAICQDFDKNELVRSGKEEELDERAPSSEEEKLLIRVLDGDFPEFFQPRPLFQQRASPWSPEIFVNLPDYIQRYSYEELQDATHGFNKEVLGSSSSMWKGVLNGGKQVAVKETSMSEISILCQLHHPNVARLRGVSEHRKTLKMYAVYDQMAMGSLGALLFRPRSNLDWNLRKKIAMGIARFLAHLHEHHGKRGKRKQKVLHVEVNSTKIYLDERFTPKFCDFESVSLVVGGYPLKGLEPA